MLTFLLVLLIIWIVAGIIGFVVHGLLWLFAIACVLFVLTLVAGAVHRGRSSARPQR